MDIEKSQLNSVTWNKTQNRPQTMASTHKIGDFYKNSTVFLTGATGFLGKALLEKLLRSCEDITTIYILMRTKRGIAPRDRLLELFNNSVFDVLKDSAPEKFEKVKIIEGDVGLANLGISEVDRHRLYEEVDIVLHSAANVRFNEKLENAIRLNTLGTKRLLDMCCSMKNLKIFVHLSTAYSNADKKDVEEIVYKPPFNPKLIIDCIEGFNSEILEVLVQKLLGKHPNTYTFSKALAEYYVQEYSAALPVAIVRPSIVAASWKEPFPGWVDNVFGITGIMTEICRGSVRSAYGNPNIVMDIVPVDIVVNMVITAAWHSVAYRAATLRVYHCTSASWNRIYWKDLGILTKRYAMLYPTKYLNWYPGFSFHSNLFLHRSYEIFLHRTLAFVSDLVLYCIKKKPMMVKLCKNFERLNNFTRHFTFGEWNFSVSTAKELVGAVNAADDCRTFDVDMSPENGLNWDNYFKDYVIGIRKFILKDKVDNSIWNKVILHGFYWANLGVQLITLFVLVRLFTYKSYLSITLKKQKK